MVVAKADLGIGNARLAAGSLTMNNLVGPAVGAALFAAGTAWPFLVQAVCIALGAVLIAHGRHPCRGRRPEPHRPGHRRGLPLDVGEPRGPHADDHDRHVQRHLRRGLVGAGPLRDRGPRPGGGGFGLLTTVGALGGIAGTASYDWLERHASLATLMRSG